MPASYPIPSWLQPSDPTGNLLAGLRQGAALGEAQAQQAQFQQQLAAHQQEQQQRLQAEALRTQAEMATQKAYREAQQSLAQDRLKEEAKRAEEIARHNAQMEAYRGQEVSGKTSDEAAKYLARQKFATAYQQHIQAGDKDPMMAALLDVPEMITPTTLSTGMRGGGATRNAMTPSTAASLYRFISGRDKSGETPEETSAMTARKEALQKTLDTALGFNQPGPPDYRPGQTSGGVALPTPGVSMAPVPTPVTPASATVAQSPFKEGQRIKNKKDGKIYVVRNGQPVPEEALSAPAPDETDTEQ